MTVGWSVSGNANVKQYVGSIGIDYNIFVCKYMYGIRIFHLNAH